MDCNGPELTVLQHAAGFVTFVNLMWAIAVGLGVMCLGMLATYYAKNLKNVPRWVWEGLLHGGAAGAAFGGLFVDSVASEFIGLAGVSLFAVAVGVSSVWRDFRYLGDGRAVPPRLRRLIRTPAVGVPGPS